MVVTVAGAGVSSTPFNPEFGGLSGLKGPGALAGGSQIIYDNKVTGNTATQSNWDWGGALVYAWADDIHFKQNDTAGWVITALNYAYVNNGDGPTNTITGDGSFTVTHTIRIYDMVPPSGTHGSATVLDLGAQLGTIIVPSLAGTGTQISVLVTGLSIQVGHAAWISFDESVPNGGRTFWLTGGVPNTGSSHDQLGGFDGAAGVYFSYPYPLAAYGVVGNIAMTVSGFKVPGPSVIALLGLSGLATLSRRRRK